MDERLRFIARLLEGEKMAVLCRGFEISRKTGYKIYRRYRVVGLEGLTQGTLASRRGVVEMASNKATLRFGILAVC